MKVIVIVALFAFVAVQVCHSAPLPGDDKTELADKKDETATPAAATDASAAASEKVIPEAKAEPASSNEAVVKEPPSAPADNEKKE